VYEGLEHHTSLNLLGLSAEYRNSLYMGCAAGGERVRLAAFRKS